MLRGLREVDVSKGAACRPLFRGMVLVKLSVHLRRDKCSLRPVPRSVAMLLMTAPGVARKLTISCTRSRFSGVWAIQPNMRKSLRNKRRQFRRLPHPQTLKCTLLPFLTPYLVSCVTPFSWRFRFGAAGPGFRIYWTPFTICLLMLVGFTRFRVSCFGRIRIANDR